MTDLEQAINRTIEDVCMRLRELPNETRYDGVELDKAGLNWAQAIYLLCQARSEVLAKPTLLSAPPPEETKRGHDQSNLPNTRY